MRIFIVIEYCVLSAGVIMLLHINLSLVDINFPLYHKNGPCFGGSYPYSRCISENVTFEWNDVVDCFAIYGTMCTSFTDFVHNHDVQYYQKIIIILLGVGAGFAVVLHFIILYFNRRQILNERIQDDELKEQLSSIRMKYADILSKELITSDQYRLLTVDYLVSFLKFPLGDALKFHELEIRNSKQKSRSTNVGKHVIGII
jgi:hypothetical protein